MNPYPLALLMLQSTYVSPLPGLVFVLAVVGWVCDFQYKRSGGRRPTRSEKVQLVVVALILIGTPFALGALGIASEAMGEFAALDIVFVFGLWELHRWRIRRKYPRENPDAEQTIKSLSEGEVVDPVSHREEFRR